MSIEYVAGDLFANLHGAKALAHGCNCQGSMGAGIAKGFRERYPEMYEQYRVRCLASPREFNLGDVWLWKAKDRPWVFNLGTQEKYWHARASYDAIESALTRMKELAVEEGVESIAIPRIGVGYGGLSWKKVKVIVEQVFAGWTGRLIVYETFVAVESDLSSNASQARSSRRQASTRKKLTDAPEFRLRALTIVCTDQKRSEEFYGTLLGAARITTDNGTSRWYRLGKLDITLLPGASDRSTAMFPETAMVMLWLEVPRLSKVIERFQAHQVPIVDEGDGQFIIIADPDGLLIEIWEAEE